MLNISGLQNALLNNSKTQNYIFSRLLLAAILFYFLWLMIPRLQDNLWNDEIYTLKNFTLVSFHHTVTDYHVPNNHVFYNLCDNAYLKLLGIHQIKAVMERPQILRLPLLFLALLTIICAFKTGKLIAGDKAGLLAAGILVVTISFQNFCLQVRGYPFSQFFDLLLIFATLAYLFKPHSGKGKREINWPRMILHLF